jgi:predicted site-specific integrase-resolvase
MDTGTIIVREPATPAEQLRVALYARVSSADQKEDLERQMQRLQDYAASKGYQVTKMVRELASGLNDRRPKLMKVLTDASVGIVVIEHRDRLTRFGFTYIDQLMQMQGRRLEVLFPSETDTDLVDDFSAVITGMASRISGRRMLKRRAEKIKQCVEQVMKAEDAS